jgi:hypothetical protein
MRAAFVISATQKEWVMIRWNLDPTRAMPWLGAVAAMTLAFVLGVLVGEEIESWLLGEGIEALLAE